MSILTSNKFSGLSLVTITLTALITSIHHLYRLGFGVLPMFAVVAIFPYLMMRWFSRSSSKAALWIYTIFTGLIFLWFGFIDGFLDHVMKALGFTHVTFLPGGQAETVQTALSLWSPEAGKLFYEGTGILTFILSVIAVYYCYRFVRSAYLSTKPAITSVQHA